MADVRRLPYRNQFDLVVSFNALHWVTQQAFIENVLDRYRLAPADSAQEANTFKFYQLEVVLKPNSSTSFPPTSVNRK